MMRDGDVKGLWKLQGDAITYVALRTIQLVLI